MHIGKPIWAESIKKLGAAAQIAIKDFGSLKKAMSVSVERFAAADCLASDQGYECFMYTREGTRDDSTVDAILVKAKASIVTESEVEIFESRLLLYLGEQYSDLGFCMQLHMGAARNALRFFNIKKVMLLLVERHGAYESVYNFRFQR